jgi:hypothetical protein
MTGGTSLVRRPLGNCKHAFEWEVCMKTKLAILLATFLTVPVFTAVSTKEAGAVVYCQYVNYPVGCVVRPGVVLRPRPVARAAAREAVRPGTPMNRGGPVNRVGRR